MKDKGEEKRRQRITLVEAAAAQDAGVAKDQVRGLAVGGGDPGQQLREVLVDLLESFGAISKVERVDKVCPHDKLFPSILYYSSSRVNDGLAATAYGYSELVGGEQSSSFVSYRDSCALGGEAAKEVSNSDWPQASIIFLPSMEASATEEGGD